LLSLLLHKGTAVPLQAWSDPEGSRKLRFPYFMTTVQGGGKVSLTHINSKPSGKYSERAKDIRKFSVIDGPIGKETARRNMSTSV